VRSRFARRAAAKVRASRESPPPGRLVDVEGHRMHITCAGGGTPAVVIIPGLGETSSDWEAVHRALASHTTACAYDRPGLGWSEPAPGRPTAAGMAHDLRSLLNLAEITPPFVLVGHSLGGLLARMFTSLYPGEVCGVVLIDSSHPQQARRLPRIRLLDHRGGKLAGVALDYAHSVGSNVMRLSLRPKESAGKRVASRLFPHGRRAGTKELFAFAAISRATTKAARHLGDLPLAVITSSERDPNLPAGSRAQRARSRFYPVWAQLQDELADLSTSSTHVIAACAGHHVHLDDPDLVIETVVGLLELVRQRGQPDTGSQPPAPHQRRRPA
jgi:pimeloyl-ACP methyl ester carboxylesterase